jgi:hypothetical protein
MFMVVFFLKSSFYIGNEMSYRIFAIGPLKEFGVFGNEILKT